jgi:hypothetical protein
MMMMILLRRFHFHTQFRDHSLFNTLHNTTMSNFFLFIVVTLMIAVSVLGMAILSWIIKRLLAIFFARVAATKQPDNKNMDVKNGGGSTLPKDQRRSSTTTADSLSLDDDGSWYTNPTTEIPMVTIQFLAAHDQDALHDFLTNLESRIHYPVPKLEILLCVVEKSNNKNTEKRPLPHGLSDENYNLILDRMEDGFRILVTSTSKHDDSFQDLLEHPPRGGLLFTFDSVNEIPSPDFLKDHVE